MTSLNTDRRSLSLRRLPRPVYVSFIAASAVLVLSPAIAAGKAFLGDGRIPFFSEPPGAVPTPPTLVKLVSAETSPGRHVSLWVARSADGARCVVLSITATPSAGPPSATRNGGGWCQRTPLGDQRVPVTTTINWLRGDDGLFDVIVAGSVSTASRIDRLELTGAGSIRAAALENGHFVVELPSVAASGDLPTEGGPYQLIGRSGAREVETVDLARLSALARPPGE